MQLVIFHGNTFRVGLGIWEASPETGAARSADVTRSQRVGINYKRLGHLHFFPFVPDLSPS